MTMIGNMGGVAVFLVAMVICAAILVVLYFLLSPILTVAFAVLLPIIVAIWVDPAAGLVLAIYEGFVLLILYVIKRRKSAEISKW